MSLRGMNTTRTTRRPRVIIISPEMSTIPILAKIGIQAHSMISQHMQLTTQGIQLGPHILKLIKSLAMLSPERFPTMLVMRVGDAQRVEMLGGAADHEIEGLFFADCLEALPERFCFLRGEGYVHFLAVWEEEVLESSASVMMLACDPCGVYRSRRHVVQLYSTVKQQHLTGQVCRGKQNSARRRLDVL